MPDLSKDAMTTWIRSQDAKLASLWAARPIEEVPAVTTALGKLGAELDKTLAQDASRLSTILRGQPAQEGLRRILAQVGPARLLHLLHWLSAAGLPEDGKIFGGLLQNDARGTGQMLRSALQELNRQELLTRMLSRKRMQILLAACQPQPPEAA